MRDSDRRRQLRVKAARDALEHLFARRLRVRTGTYVTPLGLANMHSSVTFEEWLRAEFDGESRGAVCEVCAVGGLLVSMVHRHNSFQPSRVYELWSGLYPWDVRDHLLRAFSGAQLALIEVAFERRASLCLWPQHDGSTKEILTWDVARATAVWGEGTYDSVDRFVAIMDNIIKHRGTFRVDVPPDDTAYARRYAAMRKRFLTS